MILKVFLKELTELAYSKKFVVLTLGVTCLWCFALFNGMHYYQENRINAKEAREASYHQWLNQGEKNPHSAAHYGFHAFKEPPLMSLIDKGASEFFGNVVWLESHNQNEVKNAVAADAGSLLRMGQLTLGFVLQFLIPLVIILLCYNQFTKERENETLKILLSTRANMWHLYVGKFLSTMAALMLILIPLSGITLGVMYGQDFDESWIFEIVPSLLYLGGGVLVLYMILISFALTVSLSVKKSSVSLVIMAGFWLSGVFLIPRFASFVAGQRYPTLTSFAFDQKVTEMRLNGIDGHGAANEDLLNATLEKYGVENISQLPVNFAAISLQASEDSDAAIYDIVYKDLYDNFRKQEKWLHFAGMLSPFYTLQGFSMAVSGTDAHNHLIFAEQAESHRRDIQRMLNTYYETNSVGNEALWQAVPSFEHTPKNIHQRIKPAMVNIYLLLLWLGVATAFSLISIKQFKLI